MRNGDYTPTRMQAQLEAASLLAEAKGQQNPENTVAAIATGGGGSAPAAAAAAPRVLLTLTQDIGRVLSATYDLAPAGSADLVAALQVAQLVLNHRQNRGHSQRIVAFVGSPLPHTPDDLRRVATQLRQANVALDVVSFGETAQNAPALDALLAAVNKGDTSHMLTVEPGPNLLTDRLVMSPILQGADGGAAAAAAAAGGAAAMGGGGGAGGDIGFNPELDPELATVLRESMQEYQRQMEASAQATGATTAATTTTTTEPTPMDEDEELRRALEMSVMVDQQQQQQQPPPSAEAPAAPATTGAAPMELSEDEQMLQMALQMSMMQPTPQPQAPASTPEAAAPQAAATATTPQPETAAAATPSRTPQQADFGELLGDQQFLSELLSTLPGVNPADARIQDVVASIRGTKPTTESKEEEKEEEKEKEKEKKEDGGDEPKP